MTLKPCCATAPAGVEMTYRLEMVLLLFPAISTDGQNEVESCMKRLIGRGLP